MSLRWTQCLEDLTPSIHSNHYHNTADVYKAQDWESCLKKSWDEGLAECLGDQRQVGVFGKSLTEVGSVATWCLGSRLGVSLQQVVLIQFLFLMRHNPLL